VQSSVWPALTIFQDGSVSLFDIYSPAVGQDGFILSCVPYHGKAISQGPKRGDLYRWRADMVGFVNGLPLLFVECENIHKNLKVTFVQKISDYRDTIP
jgi:hypothetical protein